MAPTVSLSSRQATRGSRRRQSVPNTPDDEGSLVCQFDPDDKEQTDTAIDFLHRRMKEANTVDDLDLPLQQEVAKKGMRYCISVLGHWEKNCVCLTPAKLAAEDQKEQKPGRAKPSARLCPACQRARNALRIWVQLERLSVERLEIRRRLFTTVASAQKKMAPPAPKKVERVLDPGMMVKALQERRSDSSMRIG